MSDTLASSVDARFDELLAGGSIRAAQLYGAGEDLCLDEEASAVYVDCCTETIYRENLRGNLTPVPHKSHKRTSPVDFIPTYRLSDLRALRERRHRDTGEDAYQTKDGTRIPLRKAAPITTLGYQPFFACWAYTVPKRTTSYSKRRQSGIDLMVCLAISVSKSSPY
jgi:hypothetical protein